LLCVRNDLSEQNNVPYICTWNSLPDSVIDANSVDSFKNRIDKYWNNFEFKYN